MMEQADDVVVHPCQEMQLLDAEHTSQRDGKSAITNQVMKRANSASITGLRVADVPTHLMQFGALIHNNSSITKLNVPEPQSRSRRSSPGLHPYLT